MKNIEKFKKIKNYRIGSKILRENILKNSKLQYCERGFISWRFTNAY